MAGAKCESDKPVISLVGTGSRSDRRGAAPGLPALRLSVPDHGVERRQQSGARRAVPRSLPRHRPALRRHRHRRPGRRSPPALYIRAGHRTNLRNLQVGSLLFFAANALALLVLVGRSASHESGALFVVIYVWVGVFWVLAPSQVWTLANYVMTTREAKRSFGFIGSGAILGWIVGGLATRAVVSRFGTESMLAFVAVALLVCAGLVVLIWRDRPAYVGNDMPASGHERDAFPLLAQLQAGARLAVSAARSRR